jgi:hypothetical protein
MHYFRAVSLILLAAALTGCSRKESSPPPATQNAVKVAAITLGRAIAADKTVADQTDSFRPADTIYLSVKTDGGATDVRLSARWTYEDGQLVDESTQSIASSVPAVTEFHVSKPDGWPVGSYKVEVSLNGAPAGRKEFKVS